MCEERPFSQVIACPAAFLRSTCLHPQQPHERAEPLILPCSKGWKGSHRSPRQGQPFDRTNTSALTGTVENIKPPLLRWADVFETSRGSLKACIQQQVTDHLARTSVPLLWEIPQPCRVVDSFHSSLHTVVKPHFFESPGTFAAALEAPLSQDLPHKELQLKLLLTASVWGGWYIVCCCDTQDYAFLPRTEASCTDDPYLDMLQFLPDPSHFIMLETTIRKETVIRLNTVEVVYLTIKWKKVCFIDTGF